MTSLIIGIAVVLYILGSFRVLRQYERGVVFFLGRFEGVRGPGLTFIFVPFQSMVRVSLRTVTTQIPSQRIITKDNVSIDIAAVAYYKIIDPERAVIAIENVYNAINQISQTTVRNVVGQFSLDQLAEAGVYCLGDPDTVAKQLKEFYDASGGFGTLLLVAGKDWATREKRERSMRLFMEHVAPQLRGLEPMREPDVAAA